MEKFHLIKIPGREFALLEKMASEEMRSARSQAAILIRRAAEERGITLDGRTPSEDQVRRQQAI